MRYRIVLSAELASASDALRAVMALEGKLGGIKLISCDEERAVHGTKNYIPTPEEVLALFKAEELGEEEAERFYHFNASRGWPRGYEWKRMARRWIANIGADVPQSFDVNEFFSATVRRSYEEMDDEG